MSADTENGGNEETHGYTWSQNDDEVILRVAFPPGTVSKAVSVIITPNSLSVGTKGQAPRFEGKLYRPVKEDESVWSLENHETVVIYLQKANVQREEWWPHVIDGHAGIDLKQIKPPPKHMRELDDGAQAAIEKMMFDQHQKRMGMPTSEELLQRDALKKLKEQFPDCGVDIDNVNFVSGGGGFPPNMGPPR
eukprot:NODE_4052_length_870_cov_17.233861_g3738_i0.p1 GENE.NODE_4052_length_870_cov_17.233861_g3738_i0~~NODE_4052_length_870_cov_17.233861_g3738_i0.p1  ORF type:complete len:192 (+),score=41.27 NODE_4052_length_870_cov_17.233861_g3738_i0:108-683(+)